MYAKLKKSVVRRNGSFGVKDIIVQQIGVSPEGKGHGSNFLIGLIEEASKVNRGVHLQCCGTEASKALGASLNRRGYMFSQDPSSAVPCYFSYVVKEAMLLEAFSDSAAASEEEFHKVVGIDSLGNYGQFLYRYCRKGGEGVSWEDGCLCDGFRTSPAKCLLALKASDQLVSSDSYNDVCRMQKVVISKRRRGI